MSDDFEETKDFHFADRRIGQLLDTLRAKKVCGCCTGRALIYHGIVLFKSTMGNVETIEMLEGMILALQKDALPASGNSPPQRH
jgi:hypothetical protein